MPPRKATIGARKQTAQAQAQELPKPRTRGAKRSVASKAKADTADEAQGRAKRARLGEDKTKLERREDAHPKSPKKTHTQGGAHRPSKKSSAAVPVPVSDQPPAINTRPSQTLDIFVFGDGSFGELGLGNKKFDGKRPSHVKQPRLNHKLLAGEVGVVQIACGGMHAVALTRDGRVLTWGVNDEKALGRETSWEGDVEDDDDDEGLDPGESTPAEVDLSPLGEKRQVVQVKATNSASFVLTDIGTVYGWGTFRGTDGVFGFNRDVTIQAIPVQVPGLENITSLASGANHMLALDKDGKVFTWGADGQFQLGRKPLTRHGGPRASLSPMACGRFTRAHRAVHIAAGSYHSFYVDNRGRLWSWGLNNFAQTGHADAGGGTDNAVVPSPKVVASGALRGRCVARVDGGEHHSVACDTAGQTLAWGRVDAHQVGLPPAELTEENTISDGSGRPRILFRPTVLPDLSATFVLCCSDTTMAITPGGEAYSWGFSANRQTGQGTREDVEVPTQIVAPDLAGKKLVWAGMGGQYGMLASAHES
ncbi:regulator of chromosome condensation 1/beta-lactamase-inhibitor protein II [Biscogniauxia marginata]|nr:regulator of chromosome condensation 1/beta-lactamase-inhibitor protein II [Biscogniauxia marginata]